MEDRGPELRQHQPRQQFLPAESPLPMSSQQLRAFQRGEREARTAGYMLIRRAFIFIGTAALTSAGCYEMYEVVQVGGVTFLEWMVLVLFVTAVRLDCVLVHVCAGWLRGAAVRRQGPAWHRSVPRRCRPSPAGMRCCCRPIMKTLIASWPACGRCTSRLSRPDGAQASTGSC